MKVLLIYTHTRRCLAGLWRDAWRAAGHEVRTAGAWEGQPFGYHGQEPNFPLAPVVSRDAPDVKVYDYAAMDLTGADLVVLIGQGEDIRLVDCPIPWVHLDLEGSPLMAWSEGQTPSRFACIRRPEQRGVRIVPNAAPIAALDTPWASRFYDFVHFATPRDARQVIYRAMEASDLCHLTGEVWGPLYWAAMAMARTTYVCAGQDFVTYRTFEAMMMGCLVFADRNPMMDEVFEPGVHYVPFAPIVHPRDMEPMPDPAWLLDAVEHWRANHAARTAITTRAYEYVRTRHLLTHRVETVMRAAAEDRR